MIRTAAPRRWLAAAAIALALVAGGARAELPDPVRFGIAVESGDVRKVEAWLDEGLPPDFVADRIGTGLMIAAWEGNVPMMALFVKRGASINRVNKDGEQALMFAAWRGHVDAVRWLLDHGAQINRIGLQWSALHYAVFAGHEKASKALIARGANINARSTNGSTPLMMAAREGHEDIAALLVNLGADTTVKNDWGEDAFVWAMRNKQPAIAKLVGSPERFAAAARSPESFGEPTRSQAAPSRLDDLIREMRIAESQGRLTPEMQQAYLAAVRQLRQPPPSEAARRDDVPKVLEIRAWRGEPGREKATLHYDAGATNDAAEPPAEPPQGTIPPIVR
ncbi:MAG: ankyrin repeat domain-containing protein [Burkholderiales bacterium]|jgi:hypothetical protein|nr:ankyrin repeat domain-containing protein [Burkholderiales bacterium]